jgi:xanthine dehydrogenase small subunit
MSLTGFCLEKRNDTQAASLRSDAISAVDGNICRCTGYKSIERAACNISKQLAEDGTQFVPKYFSRIGPRLKNLNGSNEKAKARGAASAPAGVPALVGGGTDVYVQRPDDLADYPAEPLFYNERLRGIRDNGAAIEIGASATVTDLLESPVMQSIFPDLYKHLKLVSSTPIRNMATLAGNFVNASPIGDMTVWFLALDAEIELCTSPHVKGDTRMLPLKDFYLGYKRLAKQPNEIITMIRFKKPSGDFHFNFEKVCKRTYLDIATANTAISLRTENGVISDADISAGGVAPIPLYLEQTSDFLRGKKIEEDTIARANEIMQAEISPISDVRGTEQYKRLLLRQLFRAHFTELFATEITEFTE